LKTTLFSCHLNFASKCRRGHKKQRTAWIYLSMRNSRIDRPNQGKVHARPFTGTEFSAWIPLDRGIETHRDQDQPCWPEAINPAIFRREYRIFVAISVPLTPSKVTLDGLSFV
jgi:hypothetical protein